MFFVLRPYVKVTNDIQTYFLKIWISAFTLRKISTSLWTSDFKDRIKLVSNCLNNKQLYTFCCRILILLIFFILNFVVSFGSYLFSSHWTSCNCFFSIVIYIVLYVHYALQSPRQNKRSLALNSSIKLEQIIWQKSAHLVNIRKNLRDWYNHPYLYYRATFSSIGYFT